VMGCEASDDLFGEVFGWVGTAAAWLLFLVPLQVMWQVRKARSVLQYSAVPYVMSLLNCGLWAIYAYPKITPCKTQPLVTNAVGAVLETAYILFFIAYGGPRTGALVRQFLAAVVTIAGVAVFAIVAAPQVEAIKPFPTDDLSKTTTVLGLVSSAFNIGMYAAPLSIMATVVRSKSVEFMPLPLTLAVGICSGCWFGFAWHVMDWFILIPNLIGLALCAAQITLYSCYCGPPAAKTVPQDAPLIDGEQQRS